MVFLINDRLSARPRVLKGTPMPFEMAEIVADIFIQGKS
jgi:hypothetical protein